MQVSAGGRATAVVVARTVTRARTIALNLRFACAHTWSFTTRVQRTPRALCAEGRHRVCAACRDAHGVATPSSSTTAPDASLPEAGESP